MEQPTLQTTQQDVCRWKPFALFRQVQNPAESDEHDEHAARFEKRSEEDLPSHLNGWTRCRRRSLREIPFEERRAFAEAECNHGSPNEDPEHDRRTCAD